jgi:hypothetical protein
LWYNIDGDDFMENTKQDEFLDYSEIAESADVIIYKYAEAFEELAK